MKDFTLIMAYYQNSSMLIEQVRLWHELPPDILAHLHIIIVDDGSPERTAAEAMHICQRPYVASFQLWRMLKDIRWNQDACRNLGVRHAPSDWLLLTDMDHVVPAATWRRLMSGKLDADAVYRFGRVSAPDLKPYKYHPNSWALTRTTFWECGGYDERLRGNYGTDGDFLVRIKGRKTIHDLPEVLIRFPREVIADASTTTLARKQPEDKENIRRLIAKRADDPHWQPLHFSCKHERVL